MSSTPPTDYPRDMVGYGDKPPAADWPGSARLALQIVLNYEEGAERCVLHGDRESEAFLSDIVGAVPYEGVRHRSMESLYEYGSRAGVWRLLRLFSERNLHVTVFGVGMALQRNPEAVAAMVASGHEIACHGWRWIDYQFVDEATERGAYPARGRGDQADDRGTAARLVHRTGQPEHPAARRGTRRFSL